MKELLIGSTTLLVGLAIGGLWPMSQVRDLEDQLANAQQQDCRSTVGRDLAGMLHGRPLQPDNAQAWEAELDDAPTEDPAPRAEPEQARSEDAPATEDAMDRDDRIDAMRIGLEVRRTAARNALMDEVGPDEAQLEDIDAAVDQMNDDLQQIADDLVERFGDGSEPSRRDMMAFAADTLDVLLEADEGMLGPLDAEQLEAASEEALDPLQYVDPSIIDTLSQLDLDRRRRE